MEPLTEREQQILGWIEENPYISQLELAQKAGISRSSVAVHISNLTTKGAILGRSYIVRKDPYVTIVGGANLDIAGRPSAPLRAKDSNPGIVTTSPGGAGRNIAHNLALLGAKVKLLTAFGDDDNAIFLQERCRTAGMDITDALIVAGGSTSTYVSIANEAGDMELAISDMHIYEKLTPDYLAGKIDLINRGAACIIDTNLPVESIKFLAEHVKVPLFCDPVSTTKAEKLQGVLSHIHTLKPNRLEAELLSGVAITDKKSLNKALDVLLDAGIERLFVSLGSDGLLVADKNERFKMAPLKANVVNTTGAGDSMMAAIAWGWLKGFTLEKCAQAGLATAALCIESPQTISKAVSGSAVLERMKQAPARTK